MFTHPKQLQIAPDDPKSYKLIPNHPKSPLQIFRSVARKPNSNNPKRLQIAPNHPQSSQIAPNRTNHPSKFFVPRDAIPFKSLPEHTKSLPMAPNHRSRFFVPWHAIKFKRPQTTPHRSQSPQIISNRPPVAPGFASRSIFNSSTGRPVRRFLLTGGSPEGYVRRFHLTG